MSWLEASDPLCTDCATTPAVETIIASRKRDIGGFSVGRLLPAAARRRVGPFVFFDHMGPADLAPGHGIDVRPHPHINLATVTYLFEGGIVHRDSVGSVQPIQPGAINWMTAGRGVAHSERTPEELKARRHRTHGLQLWAGLPKSREDVAPGFAHTPARGSMWGTRGVSRTSIRPHPIASGDSTPTRSPAASASTYPR